MDNVRIDEDIVIERYDSKKRMFVGRYSEKDMEYDVFIKLRPNDPLTIEYLLIDTSHPKGYNKRWTWDKDGKCGEIIF